MSNKEIFIETYNKNIHRPGAEKLLAWLEGTDFFTAPASTRFHDAYEGGLLDHSLNVYNVLISKHFNPETDDLESHHRFLHDLPRPVSKTELRNRKTTAVRWEKVPVYAVDDQFRTVTRKSVFLIERFHAAAHRGSDRRALAHGQLTSRSRAAASHSRSRSTRLP